MAGLLYSFRYVYHNGFIVASFFNHTLDLKFLYNTSLINQILESIYIFGVLNSYLQQNWRVSVCWLVRKSFLNESF